MATCFLCGRDIPKEVLNTKNLFIVQEEKYFVCWSCTCGCVELEIVIQRKLKEGGI